MVLRGGVGRVRGGFGEVEGRLGRLGFGEVGRKGCGGLGDWEMRGGRVWREEAR